MFHYNSKEMFHYGSNKDAFHHDVSNFSPTTNIHISLDFNPLPHNTAF